ncbi:MAG TPA: hypothetical protein PKW35_17705 [Nannocystaceae bacterium]|nr:hypothetical protein [Nannocystaceae bacterium]
MASLVMLVGGCPDPAGRLDEFLDNTEAERDLPPPKEDLASTLADINGTFLLALSSVIDPQHPLQFFTTIELTQNMDGTGTMTMMLQPLSLEPQSLTTPRQPVGDVLTLENIAVADDGSFAVDVGTVMVTGMANPITGSDIVATLALQGFIQDVDLFCGNVTGAVTQPLDYDLAGSTFAATRVPAVDMLPLEFPMKCP